MNRLQELREQLEAQRAEGRRLANAMHGEEDQAAYDALMVEYEAVEANVADLERKITREEAHEARLRTMQATTALTPPPGAAATPTPPATSPAGATTVHDSDPARTHGFADIAEFANAVRLAADPSAGLPDRRLQAAAPAGTHQGGGGAGEGFMLPPEYRDEVMDLVSEFDDFGPLVDEEPTSAREVKLGADESTPWGSSGVRASWRAEATKMDPSQMDLDGRSVPLHELYAFVLMTEELQEDAPRLASRITTKAAQAIAWTKNKAIVEGSGTGQPLGWMNGSSLVVQAKEGSQAADTIVSKNLVKMLSRLQVVPGDQPIWLANREALPELSHMTIGDRPVWLPGNGLAGAPDGFLLGYPLRFSEFAEALGDQGDIQLVSPKGWYGVRRTQGVNFASSIHLYFDYAINALRWMFRYGGQPHLANPISPAKGSTTRSNFVTLAAR